MTWTDLLPAFLVAAGLLLVPGGAIAWALGLRVVGVVGIAPLLSVGTIAVSAVLAEKVRISWSVVPVVVVTLVAIAVALGARLLLDRRGRAGPFPDSSRVSWAALGGVVVGLGVALAAVIPGLARPDALSQTFDANFHYNAVRLALDSGDASSLYLGVLAEPERSQAFYPAAWHGLVALVAQASGGDIISSANAVSIAIAGLAWPATTALLVRQLVGSRWDVLLVSGALSGAFLALPTRLLSFGVLFPNATGYVLVPAALAAVVSVLGLSKDDALGPPRAVLIAAAALPALGLAHPNSLFALALLALPAVLLAGFRFTAREISHGRALRGAMPWAVGGALLVLAFLVVRSSSVFTYVSTFDWPARMTVAQAVGEVLLLATNATAASWLLSAAVIAGCLYAVAHVRLRWLPVAFLTTGAFYALAAGTDSALSLVLTGPWYNDSFRVAGILPMVGLPLAVLGLMGVASWVATLLPVPGKARADLGGPPMQATEAPALFLLASAVVLLLLTGMGYADERIALLRGSYTLSPEHAQSRLVTADEYSLMRDLPRIVPPGVAVAGNPWNGSALVWAVSDRPVPFPHVDGAWDEPRLIIAKGLRDVASDPVVCEAALSLGVGFAIESGPYLWSDDRAEVYPGLEGLDESDGFELVDQRGDTRLFRITECAGEDLALG